MSGAAGAAWMTGGGATKLAAEAPPQELTGAIRLIRLAYRAPAFGRCRLAYASGLTDGATFTG